MPPHSLLLEKLLQQADQLQIDPFVVDFCQFWSVIRDYVSQQHIRKISKTETIAIQLKETHTLPFYEKYCSHPNVDSSLAWMDTLSAICLHWRQGRILFPLSLIIYELIYHDKNLLQNYLESLLAQLIPGSSASLFSFLIPHLLNISLPLTASDVTLLQHFQLVYDQATNVSSYVTHKDFVTNVPQLSPETLLNKVKSFRFFQAAIPITFLDLGKLGYETYLISHSSSLPEPFNPYCYLSINFNSIHMSILQFPFTQPHLLDDLQDYLKINNDFLPLFIHLTRRVHSWNLSNLKKGFCQWQLPVIFFYSDPSYCPPYSPPTMDLSLEPTFDLYRPLTEADIKLLTFLTTVGETRSIANLSRQLNLHRNTTRRLFAEYQQHQLLHKVVQFFKIGLDLRIHFYLQAPFPPSDIPFLTQLRSLPRIDVFLTEKSNTTVLFGRIDIPHSWINHFLNRLRFLRASFPDITLLYSFDPPCLTRWNLSLQETSKLM